MRLPLISINLLTYNGEKYIQLCLDSVLVQTYPNIEILIIDNASQDKTKEILNSYIRRFALNSQIRIILNQENIGFAGGHNQGIRESKGEFVLCLNQDVVLDKDFVKNAIEVFEKDKKIAAVQGKILRMPFDSRLIDTTGLVILKNRRIIARGQGQIDKGQYENSEEIFGVDGAVPVYKREALEDIKMPLLEKESNSYEFFDETFFMYKEDVDLAWRLRLFGWKAIYEPKAIAWHWRSAGDSAAVNYFSIIKERIKINKFAKYLSFKNQRLTQIKNEQTWILLKHLSWFLPKEIASWIYVILFEGFTPHLLEIKNFLRKAQYPKGAGYTWRAIKDLFKQAPLAFKKRKIIMTRKRVKTKEMEKWFK